MISLVSVSLGVAAPRAITRGSSPPDYVQRLPRNSQTRRVGGYRPFPKRNGNGVVSTRTGDKKPGYELLDLRESGRVPVKPKQTQEK